MAYGSDITEKLPYSLSNPSVTSSYSQQAEAYDISIGGLPFFIYSTDETPYRRKTAPYRKDQLDTSKDPGEQTLSGWWLRSQSSFHSGAGIKYFEPSQGESIDYRFTDSIGVDVWTKGQLTLLNDTTQGHNVTTAIGTNKRAPQIMRSIEWGTTPTKGILLLDGLDLDKIDSTGNAINFVDYNAGASEPVHAVCDDGTYAYFLTNNLIGGTPRLHFYKKPLSGDSNTGLATTSTNGDCTLMFTDNGITITNAVMEFVKDRIVACVNNKVYEISPAAASLPTPVYTNPNTNYIYTSISASGPAIYTAGYSGIYSTIQKYVLSTAGAMPTLTQATVAGEFPPGEIVHKISYYIGYLVIGTNKGMRVALVDNTDGSISYGPLIFETTQPVYDFAFRDRFIYCASGVKGYAGVIRVDLGNNILSESITGGYANQLRFAYANDLHYEASDHQTTGVAFIGSGNQLAFCTAKNTSNGYVYVENTSQKVASGYLQTGRIRYGTLEGKLFKFFKPRIDNTYGGISVSTIDANGTEFAISSVPEGDFVSEVGITYPVGEQESLSFKISLYRYVSNAAYGPMFYGYQVRALPSVPRQRLIEYPLACYDIEMDKLGVQVGYEGSASIRLEALEDLESTGDSIRIDDFKRDESYIGLIEEVYFTNKTPSDKRFSGFGGILTVLIRTL